MYKYNHAYNVISNNVEAVFVNGAEFVEDTLVLKYHILSKHHSVILPRYVIISQSPLIHLNTQKLTNVEC